MEKSRFNKRQICIFFLSFVLATTGCSPAKPSLIKDVSFSTLVRDRKGFILRFGLSGDEKYRLKIQLKEVDPHFLKALLEKEDRYFYQHLGLNPWSLLRAAYFTLIKGTRRIGASTLTMQLVRLQDPGTTKTIDGKLLQIAKSLAVELFHSKSEILEAYLNRAPFGGNIEGLAAATWIYFGKSPAQLTADEISFLISLPQSPGRVPPELLAKKMGALPFQAPHWSQYFLEKGLLGANDKTTLDLRLQKKIEKLTKRYVERVKPLGIRNAAVMVVDSKKMEVRTLMGSADFWNSEIKGQVDGTRALRSPGSTLKPFIYALALEQGLIHEKSLLKDTPVSFGILDPENFDRDYMGPVSADHALIQSRNIPAISLSQKLSQPNFYEFLKGKTDLALQTQEHYGLSVALGGIEMTLQNLMTLYGSLANLGLYQPLKMKLGAEVDKPERILSAESAYIVLQMLKKNQLNEKNRLESLIEKRVPIAWKTGTSKNFLDAWTVGLIGDQIVGIWMGDFDRESNPYLIGREMAAPLFFEIADLLKESASPTPLWDLNVGLNLKSVDVCSLSGNLPGPHCHHHLKKSLFIPGRSPIDTCQVHQQWKISKSTGLRICEPIAEPSTEKIFEVWPTDLAALFRKAGLAMKSWPPLDPRCGFSQNVISDQIEIVSPRSQVQYQLRMGRHAPENLTIPLQAHHRDGETKLFWYVNQSFLQSSEPGETFFWKVSQPGKYLFSVTDEAGRSQNREVQIEMTR